MLWVFYVRWVPNFAHSFHVGIFSHILGLYYMFYYPQKMKIEEGSYENKIRDNLFIVWLFAMLTLCAAFGVKTYRNIHDGRQNWKSRHQKLNDLKIGSIGLLACSIVHMVSGYLEKGSCAGYIVLALSHLAASAFLGFYIMRQSYMFKVPEERMIKHAAISGLAIIVEAIFMWCGKTTTSQFLYIHVAAFFLNDVYILFFHSSEVFFLEDFLGKQVVFKDAHYGNEYKGHFVSVGGEKYSYIHLKLKNVEKLIGGEFVGDVTVAEISSLKLADDQPSTITIRSSAKLEEFSKKRADCIYTEGYMLNSGNLGFVSADLGDEDELSKLHNVENVEK